MLALNSVDVRLAVVVGATRLRIRDVLKLSRGSTVTLDGDCDSLSVLTANGRPIARGQMHISGERLSLEVVEMVGGAS